VGFECVTVRDISEWKFEVELGVTDYKKRQLEEQNGREMKCNGYA